MSLTVYHYPGCSTCKKALRWLTENGLNADVLDIRQAPPSATLLAEVHTASGLPIKRFFNTSGQSYRQGGWKDRLPELSDADACDALAADGMLIKRPILIRRTHDAIDAVQVGFKADAWAATLGV